ncbi:uncharacterized protein I303_102453 [Kwoniella dejecticola CBS 10117]|uniref:Uncharacterized protein n=1 Tax=Kwoniella dejecticola CBS 10117 TaxID=1296121 RepID=A0A1A6A8S6_9TREE|nr:uncharacterized protein I303_02468 [Kwoniella dejecticola CBS 10117]OBR86461.1 hypothetical protein I303_02468 [Kwoniella dejecticola CBS 10117]
MGTRHWPVEADEPDPIFWRSPSEEMEQSKTGMCGLGLSRSAGVLEVTSWPIWELYRVPLPYVVALMKTGRTHSLASGSGEGEEASLQFKKLMTEWKGLEK